MQTSASDSLVLTGPDAVIAGLPYLLGFAPEESAVVLWLASGRLMLTQRIDLPEPMQSDEHWVHAVWSHVGATAADELIAVLVTERADADRLARALRVAATEAGTVVRDVLAVAGGRWRSLLCADDDCCGPDGHVVDADVAGRVAAEFTAAGVAPRARREDLVGEFASDAALMPSERSAAPAVRPSDRAALESWRDRIVDLLVEVVDDPGAASDERADEKRALIVSGLHDVRVRDTFLWDLSHADPSRTHRALAYLAWATRLTPEDRVAPVATCAAVAAWLLGDGARAQVALDRALAASSEYSLAQLVQQSISAGLPPSAWRESITGLRREECRHGRLPSPGPSTGPGNDLSAS